MESAVHISLGEGTEHLCDHLYMLGDLHLFFDLKLFKIPLKPALLTIVMAVAVSRREAVVGIV